MSEQSHQITFIPLNKLGSSRFNARKANRKADIDALAASIAAHGLLQNLNVIPSGQNRYEVVAGARRLAALKSLSASGAIAKDFAVPCHVMEPEGAGEASLAENTQRVAMDAMDEVEAFAALSEAGAAADSIARRFGCGVRHVEQRLALARLSLKLKAAYRRGDLSLDAARAFCIVDDHAKQEEVFKALGRHVTHAPSVRSHLMQGAMRANDRIARFVGLEAYEAAGGHITRDLFNDEETYIDDPALMTRIANERFDTSREDLLAKGWGWVNVNLGFGRFEGGHQGNSGERIYPTRRPMTDEERDALAALDAKVEALDEALEKSEDDDDPRWSERDDLSAERYNFQEALQQWDAELMKLAGVVLSIDHDGRASYACGIVAKEDAANVRRIRKEREQKAAREQGAASPVGEGGHHDGTDEIVPPWEETVSTLPKALTRELTEARTRALRWKLSENPDIALALTVFGLSRRVLAGYSVSGIGVELRAVEMADHDTLTEARAALGDIIPSDSGAALHWVIAQPRQTLLELLAVLISGAMDLSHEGASREDGRKQQLADCLAVALDLDMAKQWRPDMAFWSRLSKSTLIDIHLSAPAMAELSDAERAAFQKAQAKRTKDDIAKSVAQEMEGAGWLPHVLITPNARGAFELTEQGCATIAAE
jgi:ParB family transcriptional regulator, chromosome partitioning protein